MEIAVNNHWVPRRGRECAAILQSPPSVEDNRSWNALNWMFSGKQFVSTFYTYLNNVYFNFLLAVVVLHFTELDRFDAALSHTLSLFIIIY